MNKGGGADGGEGVTLRGRQHLPERKNVTVHVVRTSFAGVLAAAAGFAMIAFIAGVTVGTSGQYREFVTWATAPLGEMSILRKFALSPDRLAASNPLLGERVDKLAERVGDEIAKVGEVNRNNAREYRAQMKGLLDFKTSMANAENACFVAQEQGYSAAGYSWDSRQAVATLQAMVASAIEVCAEGAGSKNARTTTQLRGEENHATHPESRIDVGGGDVARTPAGGGASGTGGGTH